MKEDIEINAQGITDIFKLVDREVIDNITGLVKAIDVDKVKQIMDAIEVKDGRIHIKLDLILSTHNS